MSSAASTSITNQGIAERVLLDAPSFARYGFRIERERVLSDRDRPAPAAVVLHRDEAKAPVDAVVTIWLEVSERGLAPTVGPLIRTVARLLDHPIDPRTVRVVVSFDWDLGLDLDVDEHERGGVGDDKVAIASRGAAHDVHMIVRNSMGAALFLDLVVLLPSGVSPGAVRRAMDADPDVCYPSVSLLRREGRRRKSFEGGCNGEDDFPDGAPHFFDPRGLPRPPPKGFGPIPPSCLDGFRFDPASPNDGGRPSCLRLPVRSRMCTVRYAPMAFLLARILLGLPPLPSPPPPPPPESGRSPRRLYVCIDKPGNLFRVLMLRRDYAGALPLDGGGGGGGLVVVARDDGAARRLRSEAERFLADGGAALDPPPPPGRSGRDRCATSGVCVLTPGQAAASLRSILSSSSSTSYRPPSVVAFDLADGAATLNGDDDDDDALALATLGDADATILGFESDGIPPEMLTPGLGDGDGGGNADGAIGGWCDPTRFAHVQVRARSSLNVVAALSIVLHIAWR